MPTVCQADKNAVLMGADIKISPLPHTNNESFCAYRPHQKFEKSVGLAVFVCSRQIDHMALANQTSYDDQLYVMVVFYNTEEDYQCHCTNITLG